MHSLTSSVGDFDGPKVGCFKSEADGEELGFVEGLALGLMLGSSEAEVEGATVVVLIGEGVGDVLGYDVGGNVGAEAVMISGQFNGAESPTLSS